MNENTHVLLIEDNPGDADLVRLRLVEVNSDLKVSCANRLADGLDVISRSPPSVVLLDLNLPDSHGAETFRKVLRKAPGVPVVVLSGYDDEELALKAVHQGVQDYLVKGSFDSKQLGRAIRYAVERQALMTSLDASRQQQLQFKDQFLSHVSHELRTPLTCIHQFVTLILDGLAGKIQPEQREHLGTVLKSVNQLRNMIADLLEATRAESRKLRIEQRCITIEKVVYQTASMLRVSAKEKGVGLEMAVDSRIPLVHADPDRIQQVLMNLIDNALKFTPPDGSVIVKANLIETDPGWVYVSVTDTGRGISSEARALIFERLYQDPNATDNSRKGLGLGLYIAREIVSLHGGRIWVESQAGHGSTFSFTLPLLSIPQLLLPIIVVDGHLRPALTMVTVKIAPVPRSAPGLWLDVREKVREILQQCIYTDKDVILPVLGHQPEGETFVIIASTDQIGMEIMARRMHHRFLSCPEIAANATFDIATKPLTMPSAAEGKSTADQVQEIGNEINRAMMPRLWQAD